MSLAEGWTSLPWMARILRAFLGVTFVFAGAQKLLDPNFLRPGGVDYIGTQLRGFAQGTPASPLMNALAHIPVLTGIGIALVELAIGLGTLLGIGMLAAAVAGCAINTTLWLSATWHIHPYFLGSDSIYAVAWLALVAGLVESERERRGGRVAGPIERIDGLGRREFVRGGLVAGASLVLAITAKGFAGAGRGGGVGISTRGASTGSSGTGRGAFDGPVSPTGSPSTASTSPSAPAPGKVLTTLDQLPVGRALGFSDPGIGPAVLLRLANDQVVAYSRICTHAGCLVGYDQGSQILVCPCHGAEFDPARRAQPVAGPTDTPLQYIRVIVNGSGQIILPQ
jgi:thiosulfate dehydrogenase [quinone] large subunit